MNTNDKNYTIVGQIIARIRELELEIESEFLKIEEFAKNKSYYKCKEAMQNLDIMHEQIVNLKCMEVKGNE